MAIPTNTATTYDVRGNREGLTNRIYLLSPTKTPIFSAIGTERAKARVHEWQEDELTAASVTNRHQEGDDTAANAITPTNRRGNPLQIFKKSPRVSGTQQAIVSAGRSNEMGYQVAKQAQEIKRDIEATILANLPGTNTTAGTDVNDPDQGTQDASGRALAGLATWLRDTSFAITESSGGTAATGVAAAAAIGTAGFPEAAADLDAATLEPLNENVFMDLYSGVWNEGGEPDCAVMNRLVKNRFSALDGNAPARIDAYGRAREEGFDIYSTDYGAIEVIPHRFMHVGENANTTGSYLYLIDKQRLGVAYLRNFKLTPLAKTGDSDHKELLAELTLKVSNIKAHGILTGIDNTVAPVALS